MTLTFGSLFSGIGGFDLGFERAGMKCAWQCEIDKKASEVLAHHWPEVERYEDVRTIGKANAKPVDLICGGFPCQDLSVAGKRKGLAGDRSGLWFEFHRILSELRPQWVVIENVPGLLSSNRGRDFAVLLSGLADIGYLSAWRVLDAQYFGVAQRRRRVFIVASLGNGRAAEVLFEREGVRWNPPARGGEGKDTARSTVSSIESRSYKGINADNLDHMVLNDQGGSQMSVSKDVTATLRSQEHGHQPIIAHETGKGFWTEGLPGLRAQPGGMPENIVAAPLVARQGKGAFTDPVNDNILCIPINTMAATRPEGQEQNRQTFGVGEDGDPMFTLQENHSHAVCWEMQHASEAYREAGDIAPNLQARMGTGGNNVPLVGVRRLTPTECARLQGFPDDWNGWLADASRYKQFGNAVCVNVAEWIGKRIVEAQP